MIMQFIPQSGRRRKAGEFLHSGRHLISGKSGKGGRISGNNSNAENSFEWRREEYHYRGGLSWKVRRSGMVKLVR